jgi:hypothetical protein
VPKIHWQLVYGENRDTDRSLMQKTVELSSITVSVQESHAQYLHKRVKQITILKTTAVFWVI